MSAVDDPPGAVFSCKRCGDCCRGEGGIVLRGKDIERLAVFFSMRREAFLARYACRRNGKWSVKSKGGSCVFFVEPGCGVHAARPDICRAWPFFRGNIVDRASFELARASCPGISGEVRGERGHAEFSRAGRAYLAANNLACAENDRSAPTALCCGAPENNDGRNGT